MEGFEALLDESVRLHGHLCPGQVLGVRMAILGLRSIGILDPKGADSKKLMVFVEMDRCATDAVQSVTGCSLGKRTMKFMDYGKMAATFLNLQDGRAVRVYARDESRELARKYCTEADGKYEAQLNAYKIMSDDELFTLTEVEVEVSSLDMPGRPSRRVRCQRCGEHVQDGRDIENGDGVLCRPCAGEADVYYKVVGEIICPPLCK